MSMRERERGRKEGRKKGKKRKIDGKKQERSNHGKKWRKNNGVWSAPHDQEPRMVAVKPKTEPSPTIWFHSLSLSLLFLFRQVTTFSVMWRLALHIQSVYQSPNFDSFFKISPIKGHLLCGMINIWVVSIAGRNPSTMISWTQPLKSSPVLIRSLIEIVRGKRKKKEDKE